MNWSGTRVLVTGHTGFKGSWLSLWLQQRGADLCGIALDPPPGASLFRDCYVENAMRSVIVDVRDLDRVRQTFAAHRPEVVFHLAAQPLVRRSYQDPLATYSTNVMGTANVLEAARGSEGLRAIVVVTTDKCYENQEWDWPYRETDRLGGFDPYSSSKACAELVVSAYRSSFFNPAKYQDHGVAIASVRAGNVIGGGDWAEDRLIPDAIRAFAAGRPLLIRNPHAIRPWQHVLEPLRGYLAVAENLIDEGVVAGEAWNFGPDQADTETVAWIVNKLTTGWGDGARWETADAAQPHEGQILRLDSSKAAARLGWRPALPLNDALAMTVAWYRAELHGGDMRRFSLEQIEEYENRARAHPVPLTSRDEVHA